jgi:hypothetical protein
MQDFNELSIEDLSPLLQGLAATVGLDDALKFVERFGGQYIRVPRGLAQGQPPDHPIAQALGLELAQKIAIYFDGDYIQVPTGKAALAALKRQKIRQDLVAGLSHNEVARRNQVTVRTVYCIQRKALGSKSTQSANKDQLSLFPL